MSKMVGRIECMFPHGTFRLPGPGWSNRSAGIFCALSLFLLLGAISASADILPAGKRAVKYCLRFTNFDSFPEWKFMVYTEDASVAPYRQGMPPHVEEVGPDTCIGIHSLTLGFYEIILVAIPRNRSPGGLSVADVTSGTFPRTRVRIERGYRKSDEGVLTLPDRFFIDDTSGVERVEEIVTVISTDTKGIVLRRGGRWYVNPDGSVEVVAAETASRIWVIAAGVLSLLSLTAMRAIRRSERRRGRQSPGSL